MNDYEKQAGRGTKRGVKANRREDRLVNITNMVESKGRLVCSGVKPEIRRLRWGVANQLVQSQTGWVFCPKRFKLEA